jgi:hypothetical protein
MLYFKQKPPPPTTSKQAEQLAAVLRFKEEIQKEQEGLYSLYSKLEQFKEKVYDHLSDYIKKFNTKKPTIDPDEVQQKSGKRDVYQLSEQARTKGEQSYQQSLFEFTEACEAAMFRILSLAENAREGRLGIDPGIGILSPSIKRGSTGRPMNATIYFILAPIANFKILQRKFTLVDLKFDSHAKLHYLVAKILYYTFLEDHAISRSPEFQYCLDYEPNRHKKQENHEKYVTKDSKERKKISKLPKSSQEDYVKNFAKYSRQGIVAAAFRMMLDSLIVDSRQGKRVISFSELESKFGWQTDSKIMKPAVNIFRDFHPNMKPILWRILLAQVCLYRALEKIRNDDTLNINNYPSFNEMSEAFEDMYAIDSKQIEWTQDGLVKKEDKDPLGAVKYYLNQKFNEIYRSQKTKNIGVC